MYQYFAKLYDALQEAEYPKFIQYYLQCFDRFLDKPPSLLLDLACGTGNITLPLAARGFDMIGLDLSVEMLNIARQKAEDRKLDILFLHQDMTAFELYGTVDAIVCALDGVNYVTEPSKLAETFALVRNYLNPGGLFLFDINTPYQFKEVLDGRSFVYDAAEGFCVWNNTFIEEEHICCFDLNLFVPQADGLYRRYDEYQEEYAYTIAQLTQMIEAAGLECAGVFDALTFEPPRPDSGRVSFAVRRS